MKLNSELEEEIKELKEQLKQVSHSCNYEYDMKMLYKEQKDILYNMAKYYSNPMNWNIGEEGEFSEISDDFSKEYMADDNIKSIVGGKRARHALARVEELEG